MAQWAVKKILTQDDVAGDLLTLPDEMADMHIHPYRLSTFYSSIDQE